METRQKTLVFTVGLCQSFYMFPGSQNPHTSQWACLVPRAVVLNLLTLQSLIQFLTLRYPQS